MAETGYSVGQLRPVLYFENADGHIMLPPTDEDAMRIRDQMGKRGYELKEAGSLHQIDILQKRLEEAEQRMLEQEEEASEHSVLVRAKTRIRDRLYARMVSSSTSPYEREFIELYLKLREEKRSKYRELFQHRAAYLVAREFDNAHNRICDIVNDVPDGSELKCTRCGEYRKVPGKDLCARCGGI